MNELDPPESFVLSLRERAIELESGDIERLRGYLDCLYEANERMNLTGVKERDAAWTKHIFDSLTLLPIVQEAEAKTLVDVGSGGGLPGLVLACVLSDVEITLVESIKKKADFLKETAARLGLKRVHVRCERAELLGAKELRESIDVVVSRAVARLPILLELCLPLVRPDGLFVAVKGEQAPAEVEASAHALGELRGVVVDQLRTPTGTLVIVRKTGRTPRRYPRDAGEPQRSPL